jgi:hypothetical protein
MTDSPDKERGKELPKKVRFAGLELELVPDAIDRQITNLSRTKPDDVQAVAASQIGILVGYHQVVLAQSRQSFAWALAGAGAGLAFSWQVRVSPSGQAMRPQPLFPLSPAQ